MSRIRHAAEQLAKEAGALWPDSSATPYGDADGLDIVHTVRFDEVSGPKLRDLLAELHDDRVESYHLADDGHLDVTFLPVNRSDERYSFGLEHADVVVNGVTDSSEPETVKAPVKKAAKKTAKKTAPGT